MRIGVDIDDTITDTWDKLLPFYSGWFDISLNKLKNSLPYYESIKDRYTIDEYFKEVSILYDNVVPYVSVKRNAREVLYKLHSLGHEIVIISARGKGYTDAYSLTRDYLRRNDIYYDKIILDVDDKDRVCLEEKIDLFIDDSYKHCISVKNVGIDVLMFDTNYNKKQTGIRHVNDWLDIYNYVENR